MYTGRSGTCLVNEGTAKQCGRRYAWRSVCGPGGFLALDTHLWKFINLGRVLVRASNGDLEEMGAVPTPTAECVLQGRV